MHLSGTQRADARHVQTQLIRTSGNSQHGPAARRSPQTPGARTAGDEPVPRRESRHRCAAGVRRPGARAGAVRRRRDRRGPHRALAARVFPAPRGLQRADRLRGGSQPRRAQLRQSPRGGHPTWGADLYHDGVVPDRRERFRTPKRHAAGADSGAVGILRGAAAGGARAVARTRAALLRAAAALRVPPGAAAQLPATAACATAAPDLATRGRRAAG